MFLGWAGRIAEWPPLAVEEIHQESPPTHPPPAHQQYLSNPIVSHSHLYHDHADNPHGDDKEEGREFEEKTVMVKRYYFAALNDHIEAMKEKL